MLLLLIASVLLTGPTHRPITLANSAFPFAFGTFAVAGFVVALRQPRNAIGWVLLTTSLFGLLSGTGGSYAIWDYRFSHGALPLGVAAVFLQIGWAPAIASLSPCPCCCSQKELCLLSVGGGCCGRILAVGTVWVVADVRAVAATGSARARHQSGLNRPAHQSLTTQLD